MLLAGSALFGGAAGELEVVRFAGDGMVVDGVAGIDMDAMAYSDSRAGITACADGELTSMAR
jgi:hypothetical protein